ISASAAKFLAFAQPYRLFSDSLLSVPHVCSLVRNSEVTFLLSNPDTCLGSRLRRTGEFLVFRKQPWKPSRVPPKSKSNTNPEPATSHSSARHCRRGDGGESRLRS